MLLLAFVSLFSMPLQANDRGTNLKLPTVKLQPVAGVNQLAFASIATEVIRIVSTVRGSVITDDNATLRQLSFTDDMVKAVLQNLRDFVKEKSHGNETVKSSEVDRESSSSMLVTLITNKLIH